jgi:hypothetical protein
MMPDIMMAAMMDPMAMMMMRCAQLPPDHQVVEPAAEAGGWRRAPVTKVLTLLHVK